MAKNKYFTDSKKLSAILRSIFILASKNLFSIRLVVFSLFFLQASIIKKKSDINHLKSYNIYMTMNSIPFTNSIKMNL
jgi:hypothetical protein